MNKHVKITLPNGKIVDLKKNPLFICEKPYQQRPPPINFIPNQYFRHPRLQKFAHMNLYKLEAYINNHAKYITHMMIYMNNHNLIYSNSFPGLYLFHFYPFLHLYLFHPRFHP